MKTYHFLLHFWVTSTKNVIKESIKSAQQRFQSHRWVNNLKKRLININFDKTDKNVMHTWRLVPLNGLFESVFLTIRWSDLDNYQQLDGWDEI